MDIQIANTNAKHHVKSMTDDQFREFMVLAANDNFQDLLTASETEKDCGVLGAFVLIAPDKMIALLEQHPKLLFVNGDINPDKVQVLHNLTEVTDHVPSSVIDVSFYRVNLFYLAERKQYVITFAC